MTNLGGLVQRTRPKPARRVICSNPVMFFLNGHTQDTYGQMVVYARLNGVTPPASAPRP